MIDDRIDASLRGPSEGLPRPARAWLLVGLVGLVLTVAAGLWAATLLALGYRLPATAWAQFGRLRPVHTRLAVHLWLLPTAIGVLRARLRSAGGRLDVAAPWSWLLLQVSACAWLVGAGTAGPAYAETPALFDLVGLVLLVPTGLALVRGLRDGAEGHEGTGLLYAAEMLAWGVLLTVAVHVFPAFASAPQSAALHRAWLADSIGLVVTPAAAAVAYLSLPAVTGGPSRRPLLGRIGFYTLAATYVFAGGRHALFGPQSPALATAGWLSSVAIVVPSAALAWNVLESTLRGRSASPAHRSASAWLFLGGALWLLLALQGGAQSLPAVNALVSKTDWVPGHAHLALFGAAGALLLGGVQGVLADQPRPPRRTSGLLRVTWLAVTLTMLVALSIRGLRESALDLAGTPYPARFAEIQGMWHVRLGAGFLLALPLLLWAAAAARSLLLAPAERAPDAPRGARSPLLGRAVAALGAGLGSLAVVAALAPAPAEPAAPAARVEDPGARLFLREGCGTCHTLAPRDLPVDRALHGTPLDPAAAPPWPGTRRIGPDLIHVGSRRSGDWLRRHLLDARSDAADAGHLGTPRTAMPSFAYLTESELAALVRWLERLE